ncbi:hypothetical protein MC885_001444 [Smutsia gigantea]|nr:hypothetical protein MC885_001444 [Smutsia gigantea]
MSLAWVISFERASLDVSAGALLRARPGGRCLQKDRVAHTPRSLLNEVLKVMKYERCQADQAELTIDLHFLEKETKFQRERLSDLKHRNKESGIKSGCLGLSPFSLIKGWTPVVDLSPPMSPLSFDPASEEVYARSTLAVYCFIYRYHNQENDCRRASDTLRTVYYSASSPASFLLRPGSLSSDRNNVTLFEKDMKIRTPSEKNKTSPKKTAEFEVEDCVSSNTAKNSESSEFGGALPAKKSDLFQNEQDDLVEEVARAVLSDSPQPSKGKEVKLEELIDSLASNPFLTRNRIP